MVGYPIHTMADMRKALVDRIDYFEKRGCRVSDHALDYCFCVEASEEALNDIFARAKAGKAITWEEQLRRIRRAQARFHIINSVIKDITPTRRPSSRRRKKAAPSRGPLPFSYFRRTCARTGRRRR